MGKSTQWNQQEEQILLKEFNIDNPRKWKHVSGKLLQNGFIKSEAECRQRYVNHLDPKLSKQKDISQEQLRIIYEKYQEHGPKWCMIQAYVPQRTQVRIKNTFYGNIRLFLKKMYKFFSKKTAVFINKLTTQDLQAIYEGIEQFSGLYMIRKDFRRFNYRINAQTSFLMIKQNQKKYLELINRIISFNTKLHPILSKQKKVYSQRIEQNKQSFGKVDNSINDQIKIIQKQQEKTNKIDTNQRDISKEIPEQHNKNQQLYYSFYQFLERPVGNQRTLLNLEPYVKYATFNDQLNQNSRLCYQGLQNPFIYQSPYNPFFYTTQAPFQISNNMNMYQSSSIGRSQEQQNFEVISRGEEMIDQ